MAKRPNRPLKSIPTGSRPGGRRQLAAFPADAPNPFSAGMHSLATCAVSVTLEAGTPGLDAPVLAPALQNRLDLGRLITATFSSRFLNTRCRELLRQFSDDSDSEAADDRRLWQQAGQVAAQLNPAADDDNGAGSSDFFARQTRLLLPVLLYAAAAMDETPLRVAHWLASLDTQQTVDEIRTILDWRHNAKALEIWAGFSGKEPKLRTELAASMREALKQADRQLAELDKADTLDLESDAALTISGNLQPRDESGTVWLKAFAGALLLSLAPAAVFSATVIIALGIVLAVVGTLAYLRHVIRSGGDYRQARLAAWQQLAQLEQAPADPEEGFEIYGAEKRIHGDEIVFGCALYRWQEEDEYDRKHGAVRPAGWQRQRAVRVDAAGAKTSWPAETPIEQLTGAWADWTHHVGQLNESRYQQAGLNADARADARAESRRQQEQLADSKQIASLLPGPTVVPAQAKKA